MNFISTRGQTPALGFSDAVATGLAPDGGLFLPESLPQFSANDLARFAFAPTYADLCADFFKHFATDIDEATLRGIVQRLVRQRFSLPSASSTIHRRIRDTGKRPVNRSLPENDHHLRSFECGPRQNLRRQKPAARPADHREDFERQSPTSQQTRARFQQRQPH